MLEFAQEVQHPRLYQVLPAFLQESGSQIPSGLFPAPLVVKNNAVTVAVGRWMVATVVEAVHEVEGARVVLLNLKLAVLSSKAAVHIRRGGTVRKRHR